MKSGHTTVRRSRRALAWGALTLGAALHTASVLEAAGSLVEGSTVEGSTVEGSTVEGPLSEGLLPRTQAQAQEPDWIILPLPAREAGPRQPGAALNGRHLLGPETELSPAVDLGPELPRRLAEDLTMGAATAAGARIQLLDGSLLVRGTAEAHAAARGALRTLDGALAQLRFDVGVRLMTAGPSGATLIQERRQLRSGGVAVFGQREHAAFVHGYQIEVASEASIGAPEIGTALVGEVLHLWASTSIDGVGARQLFVQGFLDVSRITSIEDFDPEIAALGTVEQPALESTQVMFAGLVPTTGPLRLTASGPTEATAKLILEIDAAPLRAGTANEAVIDLARGLWRAQHRSPHSLAPDGPPALRPGETPAGLAQLEARQFPSRGSKQPRSTEALLFAPADAPVSARRMRRLSEALDPLSGPAEVSLAWGDFTASIPTVEGTLLRVGRTRETTMVVGYEPQLANDAALCSPVIEHVMTGTLIEAVLRDGKLVGRGYRQSVTSERVHGPAAGEPDTPRSGRLQLPVRTRRSFPLQLMADRVEQPDPGVTVSWSSQPSDER